MDFISAKVNDERPAEVWHSLDPLLWCLAPARDVEEGINRCGFAEQRLEPSLLRVRSYPVDDRNTHIVILKKLFN